MQAYISTAGGYVSNPDATSNCQFCSTRTTDQFLGGNFNIDYGSHWWHLGVFCAFILFNVTSLSVLLVALLIRFLSGLCHLRLDMAVPHS
jgi:ATP-binding cassette, subfamily G (WHITE), member 2, SNQ2